MLASDFWTTNLLAMKSVQDAVGSESIALYIFGSALRTFQPNDLDLLLIYDRQLLSTESALSLRRRLSKSIAMELGFPADLVLLSKSEAQQSRFVEMEGAVLVSIPQSEPNSSCCGRAGSDVSRICSMAARRRA